MENIFTTLFICLTVVICFSTLCVCVTECVATKYDYWKSYDEGITSNLNKQLEYNNLKK